MGHIREQLHFVKWTVPRQWLNVSEVLHTHDAYSTRIIPKWQLTSELRVSWHTSPGRWAKSCCRESDPEGPVEGAPDALKRRANDAR